MQKNTLVTWGIIIISFAGILNAGYLTMQHFIGFPIECNVLNGCEVVTASAYSAILGIPIALFGLLFYIAYFVAGMSIRERHNERLVTLMWYTVSIAFVISIILTLIQALILQAFCQYCVFSALEITALFVLTLLLKKQGSINIESSNGKEISEI